MTRIHSWKNWFRANPLKTLLLVLIVVAASLGTAYAYLASLSGAAGPRVTVTSPPLEFSMELYKTEFQSGENITVKFRLKNISNKTTMLTWLSVYEVEGVWMPFDFYIMNANNTGVYRWTLPQGSFPMAEDNTFSPGQQLERVYVWNQKFNYPIGYPEVQVPSGTYIIRGVLGPILIDRMGGWSKPKTTLETPPITFVIK